MVKLDQILVVDFGTRHINVKTLFAIAYGLPKEIGMATALQLLNLPLEGTHHRGGDDAWNIAQILATLLWQNRTEISINSKE